MKCVRLMKYIGATTLVLLAATAIAKPTDVSAYELDYPTQEEIRQKYSEMEFSVLKDVEYTKDYSTKNHMIWVIFRLMIEFKHLIQLIFADTLQVCQQMLR